MLRDQEPSGVLLVFCGKDGKWKKKLEEFMQLNQVLLALGDVKYDVLSYLNAHPSIQIIEMSTRYIKKREKGLGLKIKIKLKGNRTNSQTNNQRIGFNEYRGSLLVSGALSGYGIWLMRVLCCI